MFSVKLVKSYPAIDVNFDINFYFTLKKETIFDTLYIRKVTL
jgi:hypothetical protein